MTFDTVTTPAAVLDEVRLDRNIRRMQERMNTLGVTLRPHVKTSKCAEVVRRQVAAGAQGLTVSTLREAEEFFACGFADLFLAVAIVPQKLDRALQLVRQGAQLTVLVDAPEAARAVVAAGRAGNHRFPVMIEIDSDGHRAGVDPDSALLIEIGGILAEAGMLAGVMTHAGSSYELNETTALQRLAEQERSLAVRAAERLREAGFACPRVSVGSTPTALSAQNLAGVTEVRAGVYAFFDLVMANVGVCAVDDIALSVLTTVIGHKPDKGWILVDAGWMAMSRDRGTARQATDYGYGAVCDTDGRRLGGLTMTGANQEHGIVAFAQATPDDVVTRFPLGSQLRILPNHACATGAQHDRYTVAMRDGTLQTWPRFNGW
jgi:D-serine deaminase-like pyridoxal phosphate-dependent protein